MTPEIPENVRIRPKGGTFLQALLPFPPPDALLSLTNLRKLVVYVRCKGDYPNVTKNTWMQISWDKLRLSPPLASAYFDLFHCVCQPNHQSQDKSVPLASFVVFLGVHSMISPKTRSKRISDERAVIPSNDVSGAVPQSLSNADMSAFLKCDWESAALIELRSRVCGLVHVVSICHNLSILDSKAAADDSPIIATISIQAISALDLFFEANLPGVSAVVPLSHLVTFDPEATSLRLASGDFAVRAFSEYVCKRMTGDPLYLLATVPMSVPSLPGRTSRLTHKTKAYIGITSAHSKHNRIVVIACVKGRHVKKETETIEGTVVKVMQCRQAYIYVMNKVNCAVIQGCSESRVIIEKVEATVRLHSSNNCTLHLLCQTLIVSECKDCIIYVTSECQVIILNGNERLNFAPSNCFLPSLVDLGCSWPNKMLDLSCENTNGVGSKAYNIIPPEEFYIFSPPFKQPEYEEQKGKLHEWLPAAYARACDQRRLSVQDIDRQLQACASPLKRDLVKQLYNQCQDWMKEQRYEHEITSLRDEINKKM